MRRKLLATLLTVSMLAALFTGCGSDSAGQNDSMDAGAATDSQAAMESGKVDLKVWTEEDAHDLTQMMIDSFIQNYAGQADFNITIEHVADADVRNVLLGDINNAADVFTFPDDQLQSMVAAGALEPVENAAQISSANLADAVEAATINGTLYAYPATADNGYFLYYNKKYFKDEDLNTLDSILAIAAENGKKMTMDFTFGWYLYSFFGNTGLDMHINEDGITNFCNWNSTEGDITGVEIAQAVLDITSNPGFMGGGDTELNEGAANDTVIAGVSGVWNAVNMKNVWGSDYGACKLPTYTCDGKQIQMASFKGYKMIGVNYYSKHKQWAQKLADWMTNEENQTLRFTQRSQGPSNINAAASDEILKEPAILAVIEQGKFGKVQRVGNNYWTPCSEFGAKMVNGNADNVPLQDIMDKLVEGITQM